MGQATAKLLASTAPVRIAQLDLLRGLMVALMVLDHVRDYYHVSAQLFDAADPTKSWPALFATRWITHLCAPTFVFLAGASVGLRSRSAVHGDRIGSYLVGRGLWLILLELTVISFAFNFAAPFLFIQVIFAIGGGMILLALLRRAGRVPVGAAGCAILLCEPLLVGFGGSRLGVPVWLVSLLVRPALLAPAQVFIAYPLLPWFAVMCLGYASGSLWELPEERRNRILARAGLTLFAIFVALRWIDQFGDFRHWRAVTGGLSVQIMAFLNVSKYPPSLDFVAATLGCSALMASQIERLPLGVSKQLLAFGRTPFLTYLLHIFLVHGSALLAGWAAGFPPSWFTHFLEQPQALAQAGWGVPLWAVYLIWLSVLAALYPVARRFAHLRATSCAWWLSYL